MAEVKTSLDKKRSHLSGARYLGSAKSGTHHWWMQRVTSVGLLFLGPWFLVEMFLHPQLYVYENTLAWLASPVNAGLLILTILLAFYHGALGMQVVIEDYVHRAAPKLSLLYGMKFLAVVLSLFATIAIIKTHINADAQKNTTELNLMKDLAYDESL